MSEEAAPVQRIQFGQEIQPVKSNGVYTSTPFTHPSLSEKSDGVDLEARAVRIAEEDSNRKKKQVCDTPPNLAIAGSFYAHLISARLGELTKHRNSRDGLSHGSHSRQLELSMVTSVPHRCMSTRQLSHPSRHTMILLAPYRSSSGP